MSQRKPSKYWTLLAVLFSSSASIFIRLADTPPLAAAYWRMAFSVALLAGPVLLRHGTELMELKPRELLLCILSGAALALHFGAWIMSLSLTTVAASTVLVSTSPLFVVLFSMAFERKKPPKALLWCLPSALLGTALTVWGGNSGSFRGGALALLGAAAVAIYLMLGAHLREHMSAGVYALTVYAAAAVFLMAACAATGTPLGGYSGKQFFLFLLMALVCTIGGHTLNNFLLKYWTPQLLSLMSLLEPVFSGLLAFIILREVPGGATIPGGLLLLFSLGLYLKKEN